MVENPSYDSFSWDGYMLSGQLTLEVFWDIEVKLGYSEANKIFPGIESLDLEGEPLGIALHYNKKELPFLTEWKMPAKGFYVVGLEPGTVTPHGRGVLREQGRLPMLEAQAQYLINITFEVLDSDKAIESLEKQGESLKK